MGLIDDFRIFKILIMLFLLFFHELSSKSIWKSSGRNARWFQFRCCENNNELPLLFQNDPPFFASPSKIPPTFFVTLSHTIESITNSSEG